MRMRILHSIIGLLLGACCLPVFALQSPNALHVHLKVYEADSLKMTINYWKQGELVRRDYETNLFLTYITTPKGTYLIVNRQDRGVRLNNDSPALKGKLVEEYATWPMEDVDQFIKDWKAKLVGKGEITVEGKKYKALKYTYQLPDGKTTATLWLEEESRRPLRVVWGENKNVGVPLSQVKDPSTVERQTRIDYVKYTKDTPASPDLFKPPSTVVDMGDGGKLLGPRDRTPGESGGSDKP